MFARIADLPDYQETEEDMKKARKENKYFKNKKPKNLAIHEIENFLKRDDEFVYGYVETEATNKDNTMRQIKIDRFLKDSELDKRNFFNEELEILSPDVIITANLWNGLIKEEYLNLCLPESNFQKTKNIIHNRESIAEYGKYNLNDKIIDFIDLYHFSTPGKSDKYCYYNPVMKILFNKNRK